MKLRRAAALALVGWYLMVPPIPLSGPNRYTVDPNVPLSKWRIFQGFDTASDCTDTLGLMDKKLEQKYGKNYPHGLAEHAGEKDYALDSGNVLAQCIATDDPRLMPPRNP